MKAKRENPNDDGRDRLRVLMALRTALTSSANNLSDAYSLAGDRTITHLVDVGHLVEEAEKAVEKALQKVEDGWPL